MLDACAPGWTRKEYTHFWCVMYGNQTFPNLPKRTEVQVGHVKKMARHLGILACAKKSLSI